MIRKTERYALAGSTPGTRREVLLHRYGPHGCGRRAYLQASIHADEIPAMLALHHLMGLLDDAAAADEVVGEILLVPYANPIGLDQFLDGAHSGRYELAGGGNFNRNWPDLTKGLAADLADVLGRDEAKNVAAIRAALRDRVAALPGDSELASLRRLLAGFAVEADVVFDVHCDNEALMHYYTTNGLWPESGDVAAELGCRAVLLAEDSGGGAFDECFSAPWSHLRAAFPALPIPLACQSGTVELRGEAEVADELAAEDARALFRCLQRRGFIAGDPGPAPAPLCEATELTACAVVRAPDSGVVAYAAAPGDSLQQGDRIAWLIDPAAENPAAGRQAVTSPTDGLMLSRPSRRFVRAGDNLAKVVGKDPLPDRLPGQLMAD